MEDLDFLVDFVARNSNKIVKIRFGRKNQVSRQYVHIWANGTCYTSSNERDDQEYDFFSFLTFKNILTLKHFI
jgi:hypothetical protein